MKVLSIFLTGFFALLAALGIGTLLVGKAPLPTVFIVIIYIATAMALNSKGGKVTLYIAYFCGGFLSLSCIGAIYVVITTITGDEFESLLFGAMVLFSSVGLSTIYCLRKSAHS